MRFLIIGKYEKILLRIIFIIWVWATSFPGFAQDLSASEEMSEEEIEAWFNDDSEERALAVNEGELKFLKQKPDKPVHHLHNIFTIEKESLTSGWVGLLQCHMHLDAVSATQIVYRYKRMNNLHIESYSGIAKVWVDGKSVQLEGINQNARLCVRAEVGILQLLGDSVYVLKNGPFHRKFLDGYYPMQVTLNIRYPSSVLRIDSVRPEIKPGLTLNETHDELTLNALFEGMLTTEVRFKKLHQSE